MLAYTAVDGLHAISRDFDLHWQPDVTDAPTAAHRDWRINLGAGRQALSTLALLLPVGLAAWIR
ncbi:MAG: hypothetical protein JNM64_17815 [Chloroflexia bacterium]|nr:hypothetical protein [Chloroflexia bacterium]